jgi:hypothetical protein
MTLRTAETEFIPRSTQILAKMNDELIALTKH